MKVDICKANPAKRIFGVVLIAAFFVALLVPTVRFTLGQFSYQQSVSLVENSNFSQAFEKLNRAAAWQPNDAAIQYELGIAYLQMALNMDGMLQKVMAEKAAEYFRRSQTLNPLDPETAYGLARASELQGDKTREQTLAAYRRAMDLWPNNSLYRRAFVRELYRQGQEKELLATVQILGAIDPGSYGQLQREPYWADDTRQAFVRGVDEAISKNIGLRQAHMALAAILEKQGKWSEAAAEYQKGMGYEPHNNTEHDFYRLGALLLHSDRDEAVKVMLQGLAKSTTREKDMEGLYNMFRETTDPEFQLAFYRKVKDRFPSTLRVDILMARTLVDAKQFDEAKKVLEQLTLKEQAAEPWYWLARIGELTGDWDAMELAIQKATVRDPANSDYHMMFSRALARQHKYRPAEEQADRAIETAAKPSAGLYNYRAGMRWNQENYQGALEDWQEANRLQPNNAAFYGQIGQAYKMLGQYDLAMAAYSEALQRDPDNERYKKELGKK